MDLRTEIFPQSLDSVYESSDDYDELLFFLLVGQNSSSSLTSKTSSTMLKGAAEPGSLQLKLDSLHICQNSHQNQLHKDQANNSSRSSAQYENLPAFLNSTARKMKIRKWQCFRNSSRSSQFYQMHCSAHCIRKNGRDFF